MTTNPRSISFDTTLMSTGNNTGIAVPAELLGTLGAGKRPPVDVELNGYRYRSTIGVMGGQSLVSVSAAVRAVTGLAAGDAIHVTLTLNDTPQTVDIPPDFADALRTHPEAETFFANLSNSLQRYHLDNIASAKTDETRQRRITVAVDLFLEGKKR